MQINWEIAAAGIIAPEGPAVDLNGHITLVSRWTGKVVQASPAGRVTDLVQTGGKPQSVAWMPSGRLLLADANNHALLEIDPRSGALNTLADNVDGSPFLGPNDLVVYDANVVYLTDPGLDMEAPGQVLRIELATGQASVMAQGLRFPNGITLSEDGRRLLVAESVTHRVLAYELLDQGTRLGPARVVCEFPDHHPDGIALDSAGNLLVTLCGGGALEVVAPDGSVTASLSIGGAHVTNCVFGGPEFRTLYVTEDDQQALLRAEWPVPGQRRYSRSRSEPPVV